MDDREPLGDAEHEPAVQHRAIPGVWQVLGRELDARERSDEQLGLSNLASCVDGEMSFGDMPRQLHEVDVLALYLRLTLGVPESRRGPSSLRKP